MKSQIKSVEDKSDITEVAENESGCNVDITHLHLNNFNPRSERILDQDHKGIEGGDRPREERQANSKSVPSNTGDGPRGERQTKSKSVSSNIGVNLPTRRFERVKPVQGKGHVSARTAKERVRIGRMALVFFVVAITYYLSKLPYCFI
jgi:hypothetical protein